MYEILVAIALVALALVILYKQLARSEERRRTNRPYRLWLETHDLGDPSCVLFDPYRFGNKGHCMWCCPDDHEGRGCRR